MDSQTFKKMEGHENKTRIQSENVSWIAPNVTFGAYRFPEFLTRSISGEKALTISLSDAQRDNANRSAVATASARIGTILVVAPRQANYHFQYANGSLTNTGNATLRILAYGPCLKAANGKECKENYYLMPGKSRRFTRVDTADNKGRVALWQGDKFIPVK